MAKYQIWDKISDVYTPSGDKFTADEWASRHAWIKIPGAKMIISGGFINGGCALEFDSTKQQYAQMGAVFTDSMSDQQVLDTMEAFENQMASSAVPSVEERTAAALEAIALASLPDV